MFSDSQGVPSRDRAERESRRLTRLAFGAELVEERDVGVGVGDNVHGGDLGDDLQRGDDNLELGPQAEDAQELGELEPGPAALLGEPLPTRLLSREERMEFVNRPASYREQVRRRKLIVAIESWNLQR